MTMFTRVFRHEAKEGEPFSLGEYGSLDVEFGPIKFDGVEIEERLAVSLIQGGLTARFPRPKVTSETKKDEFITAFTKRLRSWIDGTVTLRGEGSEDELTEVQKAAGKAWAELTGLTFKRGETPPEGRVGFAWSQVESAMKLAEGDKKRKQAEYALAKGQKMVEAAKAAAEEDRLFRLSLNVQL